MFLVGLEGLLPLPGQVVRVADQLRLKLGCVLLSMLIKKKWDSAHYDSKCRLPAYTHPQHHADDDDRIDYGGGDDFFVPEPRRLAVRMQ